MSSGLAQSSNQGYNPDADGDNHLGVGDMLVFLSLFGEYDLDDDGIWDSQDDCISDSCTKRAYAIIEPAYLASYLGTAMFYQESDFYGYTTGMAIGSNDDLTLYWSWFDEHAGQTSSLWADWNGDGIAQEEEFDSIYVPGIIPVEIPQADGGFDEFGNAQLRYLLSTLEIPEGSVEGNFYFSIIVADESMGGSDNLHVTTKVSSGGAPSACAFESTLPSSIYGWSTFYSGEQIPAGNYRVITTNSTGSGPFYWNVSDGSHYVKGAGVAPQ